MVDPFTKARIVKVVSEFRQRHGRDISMAELKASGIDDSTVDKLVRDGMLLKYQVTAKGGRQENRFKIHVDWRSLKA